MEKKPITPFLKVMSIIRIIQSVCGVLVNILGLAVLAALPGLESLVGESSGVEVTPLTWISIIISLVCVIVDVVLAVMALKHSKLDLVYRISSFTMMFNVVFSVTAGPSTVLDFLRIALSLVLPCLFIYAVYKQNQLDGGK